MVTAAAAQRHGICFSVPKLGGLDPKPNYATITFLQSRSKRNLCCYSQLNWDWNQWTHHFSTIKETETKASHLNFQLQVAVQNQDFREAARLKKAVEQATSNDTVAQIMSQLKNAIDDERYYDASMLCKLTGIGLIGWWVAYSKDFDDPLGRIIRITPGLGRFIATTYTPRQLQKGYPGSPIFEIYVIKNADDTYQMQVVHLKRATGISTSNSPSEAAKSQSIPKVENDSSAEIQKHEEKVEKSDETNTNIEGATEEVIKSVVNFLEDKIPDLKMKVINIHIEEERAKDDESSKETNSNENKEDEVNNVDEQEDEDTLEADTDASEEERYLDMKIFGVKDDFMRFPAEIQDMEKDSFVLHILNRNGKDDTRKPKVSDPIINVEAFAAQGFSNLKHSDVMNAYWGADQVFSNVAKARREMVQSAIIKAKKRSRSSEHTSFSRITRSNDSDPFDGLYIGAYGAYGSEVVQLKRKFGNWNDVGNKNTDPSDTESFEYVEAVKLTGDLIVPAGQVTFRAKIGSSNRNICCGRLPSLLWLGDTYKGQGRIAEFGFQNPKWVNGELVIVNHKVLGYMKGADIGFLYNDPARSFMVLFYRLKLPEF